MATSHSGTFGQGFRPMSEPTTLSPTGSLAEKRIRRAGWLLGLVVGFGCGALPAGAAEIVYDDAKLKRVHSVLCGQIDRFKNSSYKSFPIRQPDMCLYVPGQCARGDEYLDIRGVVRTTVARGIWRRDFGQQSAATVAAYNRELPIIISKLAATSCPSASKLGLPNIPFHQQRRNFIKRAIFVGYTDSMFEHILLKDYETRDAQGQYKLTWDVNAVETVDGEPETLLDYVDKVLAAPDDGYLNMERRGTVRNVRVLLIKRGAVNARDLDCTRPHQIFCPLKSGAR